MGTTLSANPMQFACLKATLADVMTAKNYAHMESAGRPSVPAVLPNPSPATKRRGMWCASARGWSSSAPPARCTTAPKPLLAHQPAVESALHVALLNRGCLIAPFHNMMLISPATKKRQVDRLIAAFDEILSELF